MKSIFLSLAALLTLGLSSGYAAKTKAGDQVNITQPVNEDLYLAGERVSVSAKVTGDVIAVGGNVRITDSVIGDVIAAGGEVYLESYVTDDIRAFGGTLTIRGSAGGDLLIFGGQVTVDSDVEVKGDVIVFGGDLELNGKVQGELRCYGGSVHFNGIVMEGAQIKGGELFLNGEIRGPSTLVAETIDLGNDANFSGEVTYWRPAGEMDFGSAASMARFEPSLGKDYDGDEWSGPGLFGFLLYGVLASLLLSIILIFSFKKYFMNAAARWRGDFFKSFGFGILYIIAVPVAIIILFISIVGIPLGLLSMSVYIFTLVFGLTFAAILVTYWLRERKNRDWGNWLSIFIATGIFLVLWLITMIPFVGWLIGFVIVGASFGALILGASKTRRNIPVAGQ